MKHRKPDGMALLAIFIAVGVLVSGWTQAVMSDAQAAPQTKEETAQRATPPPTPPPPIT